MMTFLIKIAYFYTLINHHTQQNEKKKNSSDNFIDFIRNVAD